MKYRIVKRFYLNGKTDFLVQKSLFGLMWFNCHDEEGFTASFSGQAFAADFIWKKYNPAHKIIKKETVKKYDNNTYR